MAYEMGAVAQHSPAHRKRKKMEAFTFIARIVGEIGSVHAVALIFICVFSLIAQRFAKENLIDVFAFSMLAATSIYTTLMLVAAEGETNPQNVGAYSAICLVSSLLAVIITWAKARAVWRDWSAHNLRTTSVVPRQPIATKGKVARPSGNDPRAVGNSGPIPRRGVDPHRPPVRRPGRPVPAVVSAPNVEVGPQRRPVVASPQPIRHPAGNIPPAFRDRRVSATSPTRPVGSGNIPRPPVSGIQGGASSSVMTPVTGAVSGRSESHTGSHARVLPKPPPLVSGPRVSKIPTVPVTSPTLPVKRNMVRDDLPHKRPQGMPRAVREMRERKAVADVKSAPVGPVTSEELWAKPDPASLPGVGGSAIKLPAGLARKAARIGLGARGRRSVMSPVTGEIVGITNK